MQQNQSDVTPVEVDVTREDDVQRMINSALGRFGRIDILVNNAGVFDELLPAGEVSDEIWDRVISTNLTAPMRGIRAVIPVFEKQGGGVIVEYSFHCRLYGSKGWRGSLRSLQAWPDRTDKKCGI